MHRACLIRHMLVRPAILIFVAGYVIKKSGEVVGYEDKRLHRFPGGLYHWCSIAGLDTASTIYFFVPRNSFESDI